MKHHPIQTMSSQVTEHWRIRSRLMSPASTADIAYSLRRAMPIGQWLPIEWVAREMERCLGELVSEGRILCAASELTDSGCKIRRRRDDGTMWIKRDSK